MAIETIYPINATAAAVDIAAPAAAQTRIYDIAQFAQVWAQAGGQAPGGTQAAGSAAIAANAVGTPAAAPSEGFRAVIAALDRLNGKADGIGQQSEIFARGAAEMTPSDMLQLTVRCHEFLFQCELTSNVANRSSDGVQQLFRQQS